jgi:LysR family glycine cleavage system transcriptional activator
MKRYPPLNALRAFEATARLGSYTGAAAELGVTSAAVGQQVRNLETLAGTTLFHRGGSGVTATDAARRALPQIQQGLSLLGRGYDSLRPAPSGKKLSISVPPTFAMRWLVPRLHRFYNRYPAIELRFDTSMSYADLEQGDVDLAIRFGNGRYPRLRREHLLDEWVIPVAAPIICQSGPKFDAPSNVPLINLKGETADPTWPDWTDWAKLTNQDLSGFKMGPNFTQSAMAVQAVLEGQGIALCGIVFTIDEIMVDRLKTPFGPESAIKTVFGYDVVFAAAKADQQPLVQFRRWVNEEAKITRENVERHLRTVALK